MVSRNVKCRHMELSAWYCTGQVKTVGWWCKIFYISISSLWMSASTFKTHLTWPLEQIYVMSPATPLLPSILWKAVMPLFFFFFFGFSMQPESLEDSTQQVRVKGRAPSCCIRLLMRSHPPRGQHIGRGVCATILVLLLLLPWQRATNTHMSLQEALQVKVGFNGCFSDSLLGRVHCSKELLRF